MGWENSLDGQKGESVAHGERECSTQSQLPRTLLMRLPPESPTRPPTENPQPWGRPTAGICESEN